MFAFTRLNAEQITIRPEQVVLRSADYQQHVAADHLLTQARQQAQKIEAQAQSGYEQQKRLGWQAGIEQAHAEQAALIHETRLRCQRFYDQIEHQMAAVVLQAMRKLISDFPSSDRVLLATREGLALLGSATRVTLRVHAQDASGLRERLEQLIEEGATLAHIDVVADSQMRQGGCVLESDIGSVDASVETQLSALESALMQSCGSD